MPFLAIPAIAAAVIGGGSSIASSLIARKGSSKSATGAGTAGQPDATQQALIAQIQKQNQFADQIYNQQASPLLSQGQSLLGQAGSEYQKYLNPDSPQMQKYIQQLLGPVQDQRHADWRQMLTQMGQFHRRGGGQDAALANSHMSMMGQNARDLLGLRTSLPQQGLEGMGRIGSQLGGMGTGLVGAAGNLMSGSANALNGLGANQLGYANLANQQGQQSSSMWGGVGNTIGGLLGTILNNKSGGGGGLSLPKTIGGGYPGPIFAPPGFDF